MIDGACPLIKRLFQSRFIRGVTTLASANIAGQLILLAAIPLLTRLYSPEEFGVFAVFAAILGVVGGVSNLRYELAIPLPRRDRDAGHLLLASLLINLIFAGVVVIMVALLRGAVARWTETPAMEQLLWLLPIILLVSGSYRALKFWAVREKNYSQIASTRINQSLANAFIQVVGGFAGLGVWSLVSGQGVGQSVGIRTLSRLMPMRQIFLESKSETLRVKALLKKYRRFPIYDVPAVFFNSISIQLPNFLMAVLFNPAVAGFYYLADRVLAAPMIMVSQAVAQVLYGDIKGLKASGELVTRCMKVTLVMAFITFPPILFLVFFSETIFVLGFGEEWSEAGIYAGWLIFGLSARFLYSPLSLVLMALDCQAENLLINIVIVLLKLLSFVVSFFAGEALFAVVGVSLSMVVGHLFGVFVVFFKASRH
ncbi:oligosaccharide flippase family protein [Halomonas almeriensis]|uniref:oligosaccharide flippase family protein n=1 Tax=Halomonas almeriensis TaxID=308163 RepID=UPI0025B4F7A3|nr:oligosaccharide flippase family protein [Halomonas almeriensis]MDN3552592.1 oligosaccharide flippase family protein [Halomonas almeriensis]